MLVSRLLGHPRVHLICWGESYLPHIPLLICQLAGRRQSEATAASANTGTPTAAPGPTGTPIASPHPLAAVQAVSPRACLQHLRVTVLDPQRLVSKRIDLYSSKSWGATEAALRRAADQGGVGLDFQVLLPVWPLLDAYHSTVLIIAVMFTVYTCTRPSRGARRRGAPRTRRAWLWSSKCFSRY